MGRGARYAGCVHRRLTVRRKHAQVPSYFKHNTVIGPRAFIGSNSSLIAPVKIGADAIVAAGSAASRDVDGDELRMVRAEQPVSRAGPTASTTR